MHDHNLTMTAITEQEIVYASAPFLRFADSVITMPRCTNNNYNNSLSKHLKLLHNLLSNIVK